MKGAKSVKGVRGNLSADYEERKMKGAKSVKGVRGNLRFIVNYKVWATLVVFCLGAALGLAIASGIAFAHPGGLSPKDGCHKQKSAGERHWHIEGTRDRGGVCVKRDGHRYREVPVETGLPEKCEHRIRWMVRDAEALNWVYHIKFRAGYVRALRGLCLEGGGK